VEATGDLSDAGTESVGAATSAEVEVEFDVPDIGDAVTPVFFSFANVTSSGVWQPPQITAGVSAFSAFTSSQLGEIILPEGFAYPYVAAIRLGPQPFSSFLSLPPGDVVRFRTRIQLNHHQSPPLVLGAFAASAELVLRVPTPTIGTGDVNGDRNLDLLDVTLIRRALAGLDPWP